MEYVLLNRTQFFLQVTIVAFEEFTENFFEFEVYNFQIFLLFSNLIHFFLKLKLVFV